MGKQAPGVRDGSGPAKGSYQAENFAQGKRQSAGESCPKSDKKE